MTTPLRSTPSTLVLDHFAAPDPKGAVAVVVRWIVDLVDRQRSRRDLLELDRHMLQDIGIDREQALAEGHKPFWVS